MKGLVISWFYPPATSAEGLVTFKLLKNSGFEYDVISAGSRQWSYKADTVLSSSNTHVYAVEAETPKQFVTKGTELAQKLCAENKYDFIMTRAMPPQSHEVGLRLRKDRRLQSIPWIASMADPIARNPYDYDRYFNIGPAAMLKKLPLTLARVLIYQRNQLFENSINHKADLLIYPSEEQCRFSLGERYDSLKEKVLIIPHSFDRDIIPPKNSVDNKNGQITISHLGHLNHQRNCNGFLHAVFRLKAQRPELAEKLLIRLVGNIPKDQLESIYTLGLEANVRVEEPVDYFESLRIMNDSDVLLLIDAKFSFLDRNIFFASKLADYMGAEKPILGLTMAKGPSARIIRAAGYPVADPDDEEKIKSVLEQIAAVGIAAEKQNIFSEFESKNVAAVFDRRVAQLIHR